MKSEESHMKISVIGYSGAGKSTLAGALSRRYGAPLLHLDTVQFVENWQVRSRTEALSMVEECMAGDAWIIDGNYTHLHHASRMAQADRIIFFNYSRMTCFCQALARYWKYRGRARESNAEGCYEKMDWEFVKWLLWEGRNAERRAKFQQLRAQYPNKVTVLKNRSETAAYWESLCK
jgi:adenylate kinase family enzyme